MVRIPFFEIVRGAKRTGTDSVESVPGASPAESAHARILVVGCPNVGKSVLFNRLTGRYVVVSNYPGTTVEISRGRAEIGGRVVEVVDTPGMYSLRPLSDEERVGRALILHESADIILHVVDAKNLERMLPLTLQLLEAGLPAVLAVNMMDEAERLGLSIDVSDLSRQLGIPVVATAALSGRGMDELRNTLDEYLGGSQAAPVSL